LIEDSLDASIELVARYFGEFGSDISDLGVVHPASSVSEVLKFGSIDSRRQGGGLTDHVVAPKAGRLEAKMMLLFQMLAIDSRGRWQ
jgi:hypothetical protein